MSEEQWVDLVQGALAARGITDEVLAAGQFTREATPAACSPAAWRAGEAGGLLGEAGEAVSLGTG